jgi:hypothetical protein
MRRRARAILFGLALLTLGLAFAGCGDDGNVGPMSPNRTEGTHDKPSPNQPGGIHPGSDN